MYEILFVFNGALSTLTMLTIYQTISAGFIEASLN